MRNIKLTLEYDGSDFAGFQIQPGKKTIQLELEKAFEKLFREKIKISSASGRTDAGVHAEGQVVHFKTAGSIPLFKIERGLNYFLPDSISVLKAEEAREDFHARYSAVSKTYEYRIWNHSSRSALWKNRAHHEPAALDLKVMKKAAACICGKQDFRALTSAEQILKGKKHPEKVSFVRTVKKCSVVKKNSWVLITVEADGFLYHMVRNIAGLIAAAGKGKIDAGQIKKMIASQKRIETVETLPACGLTLKKVIYKN